ncbi:MAG: hypothetical protein HYZ17_08005 [Betaproteobacteria bacterium]|nr:hypothetical protein [Betaproteobacteria bacterium]
MPAPPTAPLPLARLDPHAQVWFLAEMNAPSLQVGLAAALLGAAGTILLGIALTPLALAAASPALSAMGVPTVVALGLGATALLAPADHPKAATLATLLAALVLSVGALTLGALAWSGSEFGLWRGLLGLFPKSDNLLLWPGRVTLPAAIGLLCAGAAMIAMRLWRTTGSALPIQLLIAVVALTGAFGILTCLTGIGSLISVRLSSIGS